MGRINLKEKIKKLLLLDGAMGTQLMARGIESGKCSDYLNIESPDIVLDIHRSYLASGSDAILTNTFGANKYALARHGLAEMVEKINTAGAKMARQAAGDGGYVLGDIGPTGDFLEPLGNLKPNDLKDAFAQQAETLAARGVDGFIIETMTALDEIAIAIEAVKSVCKLPVFASMSFDNAGGDFRTMMGVGVKEAVAKLISLGVEAVGFNCGTVSLEEYVKLAERFAAVGGGAVILAEPNAGRPELVDERAVYNVSPEDFAEAAGKIHKAGVNIIGGCCGTGPEHIKAVAKRLKADSR
jgi:5-methyltetrahydrofolate--homocysteine methyltransferase